MDEEEIDEAGPEDDPVYVDYELGSVKDPMLVDGGDPEWKGDEKYDALKAVFCDSCKKSGVGIDRCKIYVEYKSCPKKGIRI